MRPRRGLRYISTIFPSHRLVARSSFNSTPVHTRNEPTSWLDRGYLVRNVILSFTSVDNDIKYTEKICLGRDLNPRPSLHERRASQLRHRDRRAICSWNLDTLYLYTPRQLDVSQTGSFSSNYPALLRGTFYFCIYIQEMNQQVGLTEGIKYAM